MWLVAPGILEEYREVASRKGIRRHVMGRLLNLLQAEAEEVPAGFSVQISPDPKDDPFCACAEDGAADFVVTLNPKDFPTGKLSAKIVSPTEFLGRARPRCKQN